jgi:hypothetical protein
MILHGQLCGNVGRRRDYFREGPVFRNGAFFLCAKQVLPLAGVRPSSQPDGREVIAKRNGEKTLAARQGLKEARSKDASR